MFVKQIFLRQNSTMQVALYARVSTRDKGQDTENQLAQLRAFAASQHWTVVHEYVDRATGKHSDREQFQRLFEDASPAQVRCLCSGRSTASAVKVCCRR